MEPHVKARMQEEFNRGRAEQSARQAGDEIQASNGGFSKIFGQTAYVEGAIFYSTQKAANEISQDVLDKQDDLKKLTPAELAKYLSDRVSERVTGNSYTDRMMSAGVFEQSGPVMQVIAKRREVWLREIGTRTFSDFLGSQADLYQRIASDNAMLSDPTDEEAALLIQAENNARTALMKPVGMDDETYVATLKGAYKRASQKGQGYAVSIMKASGFLDILDDEARTKLEEAEFRLSARPRNEAAMALAPDISALDGNIVMGRVSPNEAMAEASRINTEFKRRTGFDFDLFDYKDVVGKGKSVWTALKAQRDRDESRQWGLEDLSPDAVVPNIEKQMIRNGSWERYGALGWSNIPGTTPLWKAMGMQIQEAKKVVPTVIDAALRKAGYRDGIGGDNYSVRQIQGPHGPVLSVRPVDDEDIHPATLIPISDFIAAGDKYRASLVETPVAPMPSHYNTVDAYRHIPGETGAERIARINREVKAGADPVKHY